MPNGVPSIVARFPVAVMKQPKELLTTTINYQIQGGGSFSFCLNECTIESLSIAPEDTGCA
eukprot:12538006-Ditylum_brightwellii.AAC.1